MPPLPSVPGVVKVVWHFTYGLDTTTSTHMYFKYSGAPPTQANMNTLASSASSAWNSHVVAITTPAVTLNSTVCTDLSGPATPIGTSVATYTGTRTGGTLPASTAFLISMVIPRRYRGGKPRMYWPFGSETDLLNAQTWTPTAVTTFSTAFAGVSNDIASGNPWSSPQLQNASVSYYAGKEWFQDANGNWHQTPTLRSPPLVDFASGFKYSATLGSQRRRIRGR